MLEKDSSMQMKLFQNTFFVLYMLYHLGHFTTNIIGHFLQEHLVQLMEHT
ncbi:hypothetical protein BJ912DRAFT_884026 [Pholiota molesta]|nr:hypothetical protein BJ912DRAFT_884026 [Pholiota molesta]